MPEGPHPIDSLRAVPLPTMQRRLVDALLDIHPRAASTSYLIDALWGDRADGGPDGSLNNHIAVHTSKANKRLQALGWRISGRLGGVHGSRQLVRIDENGAQAA
jgi:hypothetical protein